MSNVIQWFNVNLYVVVSGLTFGVFIAIVLDTHYWSYFLFHLTGIHPGEISSFLEYVLLCSPSILLLLMLHIGASESLIYRLEALSESDKQPSFGEKYYIHIYNIYLGLAFSLAAMVFLKGTLLSELNPIRASYDFVLIFVIIPLTYIYISIDNFYFSNHIRGVLESERENN